MITKFIRKLLGRPDETPGTPPAAPALDAPAEHDTPARKPRVARPVGPSTHATDSTADSATTTISSGDSVIGHPSEVDTAPAPRRARTKPRAAAPTRAGRPARATSPSSKSPSAGAVAAVATDDGPDAPVVIAADVHGIDPSLISRNAIRVTQGLQEAGFRAFIVGGAVRDLLLGVAPKDFDVATDATPDQVQRLFRRARIIGRRFQIVHVQFGQEIIEVSTFRALVDPAADVNASTALPAVSTTQAVASMALDANEQAAADAQSGAAGTDTNRSSAPLHVQKHADAHDDGDHGGDDDSDDHDADADDPASDAAEGDAPRARSSAHPGGHGGRNPSERGRRRRREDPDRRLHAVDASGRVLRDNVWGEQHEDARRRDFTINAMYYDPATQTVLDYHAGMADVRARLLRMIGDPATRYREDPVRMLRVVRFAAKLGFDIEPATRAPIAGMADLLNNVPAARVFDEILKLLLSGHALACLTRLRSEGLHRDLLPLLDAALDQSHSEKFITLSLTNTDIRIRAGKPVSPGFLFAALLWHQTQQRWQRHVGDGELPIPALHLAMDEVLDAQTGKLAIQRRFVSDMKEIWGMQPRLEKRSGRSALKLLEHPRFRAAYDFLLLRCESGELDPTLGQWWTDFISGDPGAREALLSGGTREARTKPRRRRRGGANRSGGSAEAGVDSGSAHDANDAADAGAASPRSRPSSEDD